MRKILEYDSLYNEDCLFLMDYIDDKSIDCIIADMPYGQTAQNEWDIIIPFEPMWEQYNRVIKEDGAILLFSNGMFTAKLMCSNPGMWRYNLIWEKSQPSGFLNAKKMPLRAHEDICVFYKKLPVYHPQMTDGVRKISKAEHKRNSKKGTDYGDYQFSSYDSDKRYPRSVVKFPKDTQKSAVHPTQKPVALIEYLIRTYTNPGDLILDPCAGSMTTAIAALKTGRKYICIEKEKEIFQKGCERIWRYTQDQSL